MFLRVKGGAFNYSSQRGVAPGHLAPAVSLTVSHSDLRVTCPLTRSFRSRAQGALVSFSQRPFSSLLGAKIRLYEIKDTLMPEINSPRCLV